MYSDECKIFLTSTNDNCGVEAGQFEVVCVEAFLVLRTGKQLVSVYTYSDGVNRALRFVEAVLLESTSDTVKLLSVSFLSHCLDRRLLEFKLVP